MINLIFFKAMFLIVFVQFLFSTTNHNILYPQNLIIGQWRCSLSSKRLEILIAPMTFAMDPWCENADPWQTPAKPQSFGPCLVTERYVHCFFSRKGVMKNKGFVLFAHHFVVCLLVALWQADACQQQRRLSSTATPAVTKRQKKETL